MNTRTDTQHPLIITTYGTDGACAAAMLLQVIPKATIQITSARRITFTLNDLIQGEQMVSEIHICGVGFGDQIESVKTHLREIKERQIVCKWYCGRGYLDSYIYQLRSVCQPVLIACESNTHSIYKYHKLRKTKPIGLLLELARQFVNGTNSHKEEHLFWHDLIKSSASRYFKYNEDQSYIQTIQKLSGLMSVTQYDQDEVKRFRQTGSYSVPLGDSKAMKKVRSLIQRLAPLDEPVLIIGPTGSGKEVAARLLHETSEVTGDFVAVNCAILSTNNDLAHDRLFGHVSGAYTGAKDSQQGAFEAAHNGTLFLDEVAELPLPVQTQLLRVLEEGLITPLGTMKSIAINVRIITATNQNLPEMIQKGLFRMDLYHRLNVLTLRIPSLLERQKDMKSIANKVIYELRQKGYQLKISPADWRSIYQFPWHGNIRQFINILKRAAYSKISVREILEEEMLNTSIDGYQNLNQQQLIDYYQYRPPTQADVLPEEQIRRLYIKHVYQLFEENISQTADALKIAKNTVKKWIHE